jgi:hypothetical protein
MTDQLTGSSIHPDPSKIMRITRGDCAAQVLHAALSTRLFDAAEDADSAGIAAARQVDAGFCADVLDVLVGLELLERDAAGRYRNTELSRRFLVSSSETYLGDFIEVVRTTLYDTWSRLPEALRSGTAQTSDPDKGGFNGRQHQDPARMRSFFTGLDAVSDAIADRLLTEVADLPEPMVLDVGGARGHLAARLRQGLPGARAIVFDLERTRPLFEAHMAELKEQSGVEFVGGDFFLDELPSADIAVLGHVLHGFGPGDRQRLLARVYQAVRPGGRVLVYDRMISDERSEVDELLGSLHMRLVSSAGSEYRADECAGWLAGVGFSTPRHQPLVEGYTLVSARR